MATILSPGRRPALAAGPPATASLTIAPDWSLAVPLVTPRNARWILRPLWICGTTCLIVDTGTAKPTPALESPLSVLIWELTPITWPRPSSSGPPELPGLIAASVWIALAIGKPLGDWIVRPRAETTPTVTVPASPNGEPMAIAWSPGASEFESPSASGFRPPLTLPGSILSTARSDDGSLPTSCARIGVWSEPTRTEKLLKPSTTWSLVTMWPWLSKTKPEPEAACAPPVDWT